MQSKFLSFLLTFGLTLSLLFGCIQPESLADDLYLQVETELSVVNSGEDRLVAVETNAANWSFVSSQEGKWLRLEKEDNNLRITADENLSAQRRSGVIIIAAGDLQKEVIVTQEPADVRIEFFGGKEGTLEITHLAAKGETRQVDFYANSQDVEVDVVEGVDWLLVKDKRENGLTIEAKENTTHLERRAKLVLRSGNAVQTLIITQDGKLYYVLPLLGKELTLNQMFTREKQRGSTLNRIPTDRRQQNIYRLNIASPIADFAQYQYDTPNQKFYNEAFVRYKDRSAIIDNAEFDAFMAQMGFPHKGTDPTKRFIQYAQSTTAETQLMAQILDFGEGNGAAVLINEGSQQISDQPTFDVVPLLEEMEWLGGEPLFNENKAKILREPIAGKLKMKYIYDQDNPRYGEYEPGGIFEKEMQRGSDFDKAKFEADPDVQWYTFLRRDNSPLYKIEYSLVTDYDYEGIFIDGYATYSSEAKYQHLLDDAWRIMAYIDNRHFSKIFYETRSLEVGLTREFIRLLESKGFKHTAEEEGFFFFFNKEKLLSLVVAEVDNYQVLFDIQRNNRANLEDGAELLTLKKRNISAYNQQIAQRKAYIKDLKKRIKISKNR